MEKYENIYVTGMKEMNKNTVICIMVRRGLVSSLCLSLSLILSLSFFLSLSLSLSIYIYLIDIS